MFGGNCDIFAEINEKQNMYNKSQERERENIYRHVRIRSHHGLLVAVISLAGYERTY